MNRKMISASMVMAVSMFASSAVYASAINLHLPVDAKVGKVKMVNLSFRNDGTSPIKVMAGATELTVAPHQTASAKVQPGDKIVAEDGYTTAPVGTVLAVAADQLNGSTIVLR